jgi:hypothetical protein
LAVPELLWYVWATTTHLAGVPVKQLWRAIIFGLGFRRREDIPLADKIVLHRVYNFNKRRRFPR